MANHSTADLLLTLAEPTVVHDDRGMRTERDRAADRSRSHTSKRLS